jgi:tetratricopeptide (TPR) repeat protein
MLKAAIFSIVVSASFLPAIALAQPVAERFITITDAALGPIGNTTGTVRKGEIVVGYGDEHVDRLRVISWRRHGDIQGWVDRSALIPLSQALDFYDGELRKNPTALVYVHRSFVWLEKGEIDKAFADCNQAILLDPKNASAYEARAHAWIKQGEDDKAFADWSEAIRLDPKDVAAYVERARMWCRKGQYGKAIADFDMVSRLDPMYLYLDADNSLRRALAAKAEFDTTFTESNKAIQLDPQDALAYNRRGTAWMAIGESDKAIADWSQAIRVAPHDVSAYKTRGSAWLRNGQYDKAIADWSEVIRLNPEVASAYKNRAYALVKQGEIDKAIADWNEAIRLDPTDASNYSNRGSAWMGRGQYEKAIADYHEAIRLDPQFGEAYWGLAELFATCPDAKYRDGEKALATADKATASLGLRNSGLLLVLAACYAEAGDFDSALKWQEKAIHFAPESSKAEFRSRLALYKAHQPYRQGTGK